MYLVGSNENLTLARVLKQFNRKASVARCAGLLTVPAFHANTIRIETLVHLTMANCAGTRKPSFSDIGRWLNRNLGGSAVSAAEDPPEDVFISNIITQFGNSRLFEGTWESSDFHLQQMLDTAEALSAAIEPIKSALRSVYALLRMGDAIAERLNLLRWHAESSSRGGNLLISPNTNIDRRAAAVTFTESELRGLGIELADLEPFFFTDADAEALPSQVVTQETALELRPVVCFDDEYVLALPAGVGSALRAFILRKIVEARAFKVFDSTLGRRQATIVRRLLQNIGEEYPSILSIEREPNLPQMQSWCFKRDTSEHVHVVVLHEDLGECVEQGWGTPSRLSSKQQAAFDDFLRRSADRSEREPGFKHGTTIVIRAGVGRGFTSSLPRQGSSWDLVFLGLADLDMLIAYQDGAVDLLFKFLRQENWVASHKAKHFSFSSFTLFCQWVKEGFSIWPRDLPLREGAIVMVPMDSAFGFRQKVRKSRDKHAIQTLSGKWMVCERYGRNSYFDSQSKRPVFIFESAFEQSTLAVAVETSKGPRWLICADQGYDSSKREYVFRLWSDFLGSFAEVALFLDAQGAIREDALEVFLDCTQMVDVELVSYFDLDYPAIRPVVSSPSAGRALVSLPRDFFAIFKRVGNEGEQALVSAFVTALEMASRLVAPLERKLVQQAVAAALPSEGARLVHLFSSTLMSDHLIWTSSAEAVWLHRADTAFVRIGLDKNPPVKPKLTVGKPACTNVLNGYVARIWNEIKLQLNELDLDSVLSALLSSNEAIYTDRMHWRRTAKAILSLNENGEGLDAAFTREQKRNRTSLATRVLAEMAVCECALSGQSLVTRAEHELLIARAYLLIEAAYDSDAIRGELAPAKLTVFPNGEYEIDRSYQSSIMRPFVANQYSDEYREAAADYASYYQEAERSGRGLASDFYGADFVVAFEKEYGLSPDELIDCFAELVDMATDAGHVVVKMKLGPLKERLAEKRRISIEKCIAFVSGFALVRRPKWDKPPRGFLAKDTWPWLFKRRLSIISRPVVCTGITDDDIAYFGVSQVLQSWNYLMSRSSKAWMPQDYFVSQSMKAFAGKTAHALGGVFEDEVVEKLSGCNWVARARVQMTELGGTQEMGDVDVLAWHPDGRVLIIECKRLQPARTVGEVADILQKFAGEEKDKLARHLTRLAWLQASPSNIPRSLGLDRTAKLSIIQGRLVTNTDVPMMYAKDLPIPMFQIVPIRALDRI
jgi:hypothetical protein